MQHQTPEIKYAQLWDPVIRGSHFVFAFVFIANYFVNEPGEDLHEYLGYFVVLVLAIRCVWGFFATGSGHWSDFWLGFSEIKEQFNCLLSGNSYKRFGHTPIGALFMLAMMSCIAFLGITGFMMEEIDMFWGEDWVQDLHHWIANLLSALVLVHISAGIYQSIKTKENLFLSIIHGIKKAG